MAAKGLKIWGCTAIPYRASTGPEQGFPCVLFPHREKPVYISWDPCNENRFFPVGKSTQGRPCFQYRDGFAVELSQSVNLLVVNLNIAYKFGGFF